MSTFSTDMKAYHTRHVYELRAAHQQVLAPLALMVTKRPAAAKITNTASKPSVFFWPRTNVDAAGVDMAYAWTMRPADLLGGHFIRADYGLYVEL